MIKDTILVLVLCLLTACGSEDDGPIYPERQVKLPPAGKRETIRGTVFFDGKAPRIRDIGVCQGNGQPVQDQSIRVKGGKLSDVLVYVKKGLEAYTFPLNKTEAVIDQRGCEFRPHVLAVQVHQPILIRNSDPIIHNVHFASKLDGQSWVKTITPAQGPLKHQIRKEELNLTVTCDLHAYMLMYVHALDHPFFQVTKDDGQFVLKDLPYGSYTIEAVHPKLGSQAIEIEIGEGQKVGPLDFHFKKD